MSGEGSPPDRVVDGHGLRVAVVATRWHERIVDGLLAGAKRGLADSGVADTTVVHVPGAFELPVAARVFVNQRYDAIVALGCVIRGGTPHFEFVCRAATDGLVRVSAESGVPVGFGLLTCDTVEQALDRCGVEDSSEDKGREAALAAVETAVLMRQLRRGQGHE